MGALLPLEHRRRTGVGCLAIPRRELLGLTTAVCCHPRETTLTTPPECESSAVWIPNGSRTPTRRQRTQDPSGNFIDPDLRSQCHSQTFPIGRKANRIELSPHVRHRLLLTLAIYPGQPVRTTAGNIGQRSVPRYAVHHPVTQPLQHRCGVPGHLEGFQIEGGRQQLSI